MVRTRLVSKRCTAAVVAGLAPVVALGAFASATTGGRPPAVTSSVSQVAFPRHYGGTGNASGYSAIVVTGRHSAWVFGGTNPGGPSSPVAARWNGTTLVSSALPGGLTGFIGAASASSPDNVWAVSFYGRYALRWNGRTWQVARRWATGQLTGVLAVSRRDVWVFGSPSAGARGIGTWHFNGRSWMTARGTAGDIYQASRWHRDIWAIAAGPHGDQIVRYNGKWQRIRTGRELSGLALESIAAVSCRGVWVLGDSVGQAAGGRLVLLHWNGQRWRRLDTGLHAWAGQLAAGRRGGVLLTATALGSPDAGLILQVSVLGKITSTRIPSALGSGVSDVALAPGSRQMWATGGVLTHRGGDAAFWVLSTTASKASWSPVIPDDPAHLDGD
jgi:hypothetical protein